MMTRSVRINAGREVIDGDLVVPDHARGLVLFAHGSGSSRFSPRNRFVAGELQRRGLGTLLLDLLTSQEEQVDLVTRHLRFDVEFLAQRLLAATEWIIDDAQLARLRIGYFGSSTGAAAALIAAAKEPDLVGAVVSRGGRPDLAREYLDYVRAPTLLIVGGNDAGVIELNEDAFRSLHGEKRFDLISRATHLFEEPGALEQVAEIAGEWFEHHLGAAPPLTLERAGRHPPGP
jgi:dienelactone hydrolase